MPCSQIDHGGGVAKSQTGVDDLLGYISISPFGHDLAAQNRGIGVFFGLGSTSLFTNHYHLHNGPFNIQYNGPYSDLSSPDNMLSSPTNADQDSFWEAMEAMEAPANDPPTWNANLGFSTTTFDHKGENVDSYSRYQLQSPCLNEYCSGTVTGEQEIHDAHFQASDGTHKNLNPPWKNCNRNIDRTALRDEASQHSCWFSH
jgi:hypothetical protein